MNSLEYNNALRKPGTDILIYQLSSDFVKSDYYERYINWLSPLYCNVREEHTKKEGMFYLTRFFDGSYYGPFCVSENGIWAAGRKDKILNRYIECSLPDEFPEIENLEYPEELEYANTLWVAEIPEQTAKELIKNYYINKRESK